MSLGKNTWVDFLTIWKLIRRERDTCSRRFFASYLTPLPQPPLLSPDVVRQERGEGAREARG
jgi:hypothetical protein